MKKKNIFFCIKIHQEKITTENLREKYLKKYGKIL